LGILKNYRVEKAERPMWLFVDFGKVAGVVFFRVRATLTIASA